MNGVAREDGLVAAAVDAMASHAETKWIVATAISYIRTAYAQGRAEALGVLEETQPIISKTAMAEGDVEITRQCETCGARVVVRIQRAPVWCNRHTP